MEKKNQNLHQQRCGVLVNGTRDTGKGSEQKPSPRPWISHMRRLKRHRNPDLNPVGKFFYVWSHQPVPI